tara:strand:+ start:7066 stop:8901 length:1836 start_codon:yes stop_codon:yes gene_type:complete
MCGISGIISQKYANESTISFMVDSQKHRGPDYSNSFIDNKVAIGHNRLMIIDCSEKAHQPMFNKNRTISIVFNGEIYNFKELQKKYFSNDLSSFKTNSDTEIVLKMYQKFGINCVEKLNGMFAFAIYDLKNKKIHLCRDRFGIKPLFYYQDANSFIFSSEIKGILASNLVPKKINKNGISEFLFYGNTLGETTLYNGIKKLKSGYLLELDIDTEQFQLKKYYDISYVKKTEFDSQKLFSLFKTSLERQTISDVDIGIFLSGGIDSSIIAYMSKYIGKDITCFTAQFGDSNKEDVLFSKKIAKEMNVNHSIFKIQDFNVDQTFEKMIYHHDSPFSDAANIPLYLMTKNLPDNIKVVLQGDGGDEIFGGYNRYRIVKYMYILKHIFNIGSPFSKRFKRFSNALNKKNDFEKFAYLLCEDKNPDLNYKFMNNNFFKDESFTQNAILRYQEAFNSLPNTLSTLDKLFYIDSKIILPDIFFEKVDRSTMANGIEIRVPFLDNDIFDYVSGIDSNEKIKLFNSKLFLKKTFEKKINTKIFNSKKRGFGVPYKKWLGNELKERFIDTVLTSSRMSNIYNVKEIEKIYNEHCSGNSDHGFLLYKLLTFATWFELNNFEI